MSFEEMSPSAISSDGAILRLLTQARQVFDQDPRKTRAIIVQIVDLFDRGHASSRRFVAGGLAGWQEKRVRDFIDADPGGSLKLAELAGLVRLSVSHFGRAFKASFGVSPRKYILGKRIEHAQALMRTTSAPLAEIAVACGLSDQPHFNRTFRRFTGLSPCQWRRRESEWPSQPDLSLAIKPAFRAKQTAASAH